MKLRAGDFAVIAIVISIAAAIFVYPFLAGEGNSLLVNISQGGETVRTVSLDGADTVVRLSGCRVAVSDGEVYMLESDCDDKVCLKTGKIRRAGDAIICVPNRVSVTISGDIEIDAVAG